MCILQLNIIHECMHMDHYVCVVPPVPHGPSTPRFSPHGPRILGATHGPGVQNSMVIVTVLRLLFRTRTAALHEAERVRRGGVTVC